MRSTMFASAALLAAQPLVAAPAGDAYGHGGGVAARADDEYWRQVCYPADFTEAQVPPCFSIDNIEAACQPNGTSPLAYAAHAQCMCGGSFFREWAGCQNCLFVHGQRSGLEMAHYSAIRTAASMALCTGQPTAPWASLFSQAQATVPPPATGVTTLRDVKSGDTAVSLYYTATGSQGPAPITGSPTAATGTAAAAPETATDAPSEPTTAEDSGASTPTTDAATTPAPTGTDPDTNAAVPGAVAGGRGLWLALAGGALVAAL